MSKKHADEILATLKVLQTEEGRSHAFSYLVGVLSVKAENGRPVSATALTEAVTSAVESASKNTAEKRARAEEQAWRAADEAELPEPRDIPDLDPTHFSHAMTGVGKETSWCGAPGPVAVFAFSVTCPVCRTMLSREEEGDQGARTLAVSPLADGTSARDETTQVEIVIGGVRYGDAELDGLACILCHREFAVGEASVPAGVVDGGPQVFAHRQCATEREDAPLTLAEYRSGLAYWERKAEEASADGDQAALAYRTEGAEAIRQTIQRLVRKEAARRTKGVAQVRAAIRPLAALPISEESRLAIEEDPTALPTASPQPWMACADCFSPESCYNGEMECP